jgi:hypothetical protein
MTRPPPVPKVRMASRVPPVPRPACQPTPHLGNSSADREMINVGCPDRPPQHHGLKRMEDRESHVDRVADDGLKVAAAVGHDRQPRFPVHGPDPRQTLADQLNLHRALWRAN